MCFAHRNVFGDITHITVWPPKSTRIFDVWNVWNGKDKDYVLYRVLGEEIKS